MAAWFDPFDRDLVLPDLPLGCSSFADLRANKSVSLESYCNYNEMVLRVIFVKYYGPMRAALSAHRLTKADIQNYLFMGLIYIKHYVIARMIPVLCVTRLSPKVTKEVFYERIVPVLLALAKCIQEVRPEDRFRPMNHTVHWPRRVTSTLDAMPLLYAVSTADMR
jgi:hypothetical protein